MRGLKGSLLDLTENVIRLRRQLREIEIQAEGQIQARVAQAHEGQGEFDPLELDRFTRFQELTRFMAESVNDVATVQQNLLKTLDDANAALVAQARLNRGLQQELMGVRMMPFASQAERLFRIVRQTTKELGKRANFDIVGGQVELDRSVLDKMMAPVEHMLRNAVTHGIETRAERAAAGKPEIGEITVRLAQEGNEIILTMDDDGKGLDRERIRARAVALGLLEAGDEPDDALLYDFIFRPGFSTAGEVSQLAGRGVGMDVVKTEVADLGGRIEITSQPGHGTTFRLYLPLTLAVTQTLLMRAGANLYAVPSTMIEQVLELKEGPLAEVRARGEVEWMGNHYPFHYLPHLLGNPEAAPEAQRQYWVLLLRSGSQRVAVQVDELRGNQEVVVKNIGAQLARVVGIAGATVLGDGQVVLILNPVALTSRAPVVSVRGAAAAQAPVACTGCPLADRDGGRRFADRAQDHQPPADPRRLSGRARQGRCRSAGTTGRRDSRRPALRHRNAAHGRFRPRPQHSCRPPAQGCPGDHDHVAHGREAPQARARDRRQRLSRQALRRRRSAPADRQVRQGEAGFLTIA